MLILLTENSSNKAEDIPGYHVSILIDKKKCMLIFLNFWYNNTVYSLAVFSLTFQKGDSNTGSSPLPHTHTCMSLYVLKLTQIYVATSDIESVPRKLNFIQCFDGKLDDNIT